MPTSLKDHYIVYLPDDTPIFEESLINFPAWQARCPQERENLVRLLHDMEVGEDWAEEDTWSDVNFSPEEIASFSRHILVPGDNGQPEWFSPHSSEDKALTNVSFDTQVSTDSNTNNH